MNNGNSAREILSRLKGGGRLSDEERRWIRTELRKRGPDTDVHNLVRCLAKSGPVNDADRDTIEIILREMDDDWSVQGALYALCIDWKLTESYLSELFDLTKSEIWSNFNDSAITAFSVLGKYLNETQSPGVYAYLLNVIENDTRLFREDSDEFWPIHLESAVAALDYGLRGGEALITPHKVRSPSDVPHKLLLEAANRGRIH